MVRALQTPASDRWSPDSDFAGRRVHVIEYNRPQSGSDDELTSQSIAWMHRLSNTDVHSAPIRRAAVAVVDTLSNSPTAKEIADAIFAYVKRTVRYRHEDDMRTPFAGFGQFLYDQTLIAPAALLQMPRPEGDCVDFSMLTESLCHVFSLPAAFKTIAADPDSAAYSHVYVIVQLTPGKFYTLDTSNAPAPGWEFALPKGKKARVWPNRADLRSPAMINRNPRRRSRMGDLYDDAGVDPTFTDSSDMDLPLQTITPVTIPNLSVTAPAAAPSSSTNPFTSIATTVINDATSIAAPLIRQSSVKAPYYITGANGAQVLYNPSTGTILNAAGSAVGALTSSPNALLYLGIGAAVLLAAMSSKK